MLRLRLSSNIIHSYVDYITALFMSREAAFCVMFVGSMFVETDCTSLHFLRVCDVTVNKSTIIFCESIHTVSSVKIM